MTVNPPHRQGQQSCWLWSRATGKKAPRWNGGLHPVLRTNSKSRGPAEFTDTAHVQVCLGGGFCQIEMRVLPPLATVRLALSKGRFQYDGAFEVSQPPGIVRVIMGQSKDL